MPGPVLSVTIAESARRGFWAGPLVVAGHGLIEFVLFASLVFGAGGLLKNDIVFGTVGLAGGIMLAGMGGSMVRSAGSMSLKTEDKETSGSRPVLAGVVTSVSNPYFMIWWATIGLSYIAQSQKHGIAGLGFFYSGHIMADLVWFSLVAGAVTAGRNIITDKAYRWITVLCGIFLVALGLYFGSSGVRAVI